MSKLPSVHALAFHAREHFGEDGYPFEESVPSSFDLVVRGYLDSEDRDGDEGGQRRLEAILRGHLRDRSGFAPVAQQAVDDFVLQTVTYLRGQFAYVGDVERYQPLLSHLFWGHLVEARQFYGPLRFAACACGQMMTGRDEEDLYNLVRRHLWGQQEPDRHRRVELPERILRRRLVGDQDRRVTSWSFPWPRLVPGGSPAARTY